MIGALILGGAHGSLAVVRSLGRKDIPVWVAVKDHPIAALSRYAKKRVAWPGPNDSSAADFLLDLARRQGLEGWVVFPGGDAEAHLLSRHHAALSKVFRLITPPWEVMRWAADKRLTYQRAEQIGIDYPRTCHAADRGRLAELDIPLPAILKPAQRLESNPLTADKAWRVNTRAELMARFDQASKLMGDGGVVLQEMIPGAGTAQWSYAAVWNENGPLASLVARRLRQYPIEFGYTSTFVQSAAQERVEEAACRFLRSIGYTGLVEVEFKHDARDDRYKILDVNARTWAWISLGRAAGVDFPYIMWRAATGLPVSPTRARPQARWVHFSRDLPAAIGELRRSGISLRSYLRSFRPPVEFACFAADDPIPGLLELPLLFRRLQTRGLPVRIKPAAAAAG